jgi:type II secretory pathway pseudopilin PulG
MSASANMITSLQETIQAVQEAQQSFVEAHGHWQEINQQHYQC